MPRFQLLVKEPGKEPHVVKLGDPIVIGRGKAADVTVADEEVGRKQFEILVTAGFVVLKGLGKTNPTRVGDSLIQAGEQTTMASGTIIRVGKSEFVVEDAEKTEQGVAPRAPHPDQTIVSANPSSAAPPAAIPATSAQEPGPDQQETAEGDFGMTMAKGFRPGAAPPQQPPTPAPPPASTQQPAAGADEDFGMTMAKGFRPGAAPPASAPGRPATPPQQPPTPAPPPAPTQQPAAGADGDGDFGMTMAKGFRPGAAPQASAPVPPPSPPTPPKAQTSAPSEAAPQAATSEPPSSAAAPAGAAPRQDAAPATPELPLTDVAAWCPRVFVKGEGFKRNLALGRSNNLLGRAADADVQLEHASVSDRHAEIRFDGSRWSIADCGSANGTIVDGQVLTNAPVELSRNSLVCAGALRMVFLSVAPGTAARGGREEDRALDGLIKSGRIDAQTAREVRRVARSESGQSIAEIVLRDTPVSATDWASACATARSRPSLLRRLLRILSFGLL